MSYVLELLDDDNSIIEKIEFEKFHSAVFRGTHEVKEGRAIDYDIRLKEVSL